MHVAYARGCVGAGFEPGCVQEEGVRLVVEEMKSLSNDIKRIAECVLAVQRVVALSCWCLALAVGVG